MGIGDLLPHSVREDHADRSLRVGAVLRMHASFIENPKIKILVIVGIDYLGEYAGLLCINSSNEFAIGKTELLRLQHPLPNTDRPYLKHNSFVNCARIHPMSLPALRTEIMKDGEVVRAMMSSEDISIVRQLTLSAKTLSMAIKKQFNLFTPIGV